MGMEAVAGALGGGGEHKGKGRTEEKGRDAGSRSGRHRGRTQRLPAAAGRALGTQGAPRRPFTHWDLCVKVWGFFFFFHWKREATKTNQVIFHVERPGPRRGCEGCACSQKHGGEEPLAAAMKAAELVDSFP